MSECCEYCSYNPCLCGGRVHSTLYGEVPKYSREWWRQQPGGEVLKPNPVATPKKKGKNKNGV